MEDSNESIADGVRIVVSALIAVVALAAGGTALVAVLIGTPLTHHVNPFFEAYAFAIGGGLACVVLASMLLLRTLPRFLRRQRVGLALAWQTIAMSGAWLLAAVGVTGLAAS
jgi:hypothetical protein